MQDRKLEYCLESQRAQRVFVFQFLFFKVTPLICDTVCVCVSDGFNLDVLPPRQTSCLYAHIYNAYHFQFNIFFKSILKHTSSRSIAS